MFRQCDGGMGRLVVVSCCPSRRRTDGGRVARRDVVDVRTRAPVDGAPKVGDAGDLLPDLLSPAWPSLSAHARRCYTTVLGDVDARGPANTLVP
jgi:hypothetical protein